jgi:hypothetical protein
MHQVSDHLRTKLATNQFHDKASEWYDGFLMDHDRQIGLRWLDW